MLCELSSPVIEATEDGLKILLGLMVNCSCHEVLGCCSWTAKYEVCAPLGTT